MLRLDNEEDSDDAEQAASESKQQATESKQSAQESGTEEKTDTTTAQQPTEENQASDVNQTSGADVAQDSTDTKKVETKVRIIIWSFFLLLLSEQRLSLFKPTNKFVFREGNGKGQYQKQWL